MMYWKRNEKLEKDRRKKAEKAQQEKRKKEEEEREARRQQRKFNFLITQTELYAHFMQKKMGQTSGMWMRSMARVGMVQGELAQACSEPACSDLVGVVVSLTLLVGHREHRRHSEQVDLSP